MTITLKAVPLLYLPPRNNIAKPARRPMKPKRDIKAIMNSKPSTTREKYVSKIILVSLPHFF